MDALPVILALLFLFVAVRVVRLAVDPSARENAPRVRAPHSSGAVRARTAP